jgi:NAD+ synthase
MRDYEQELKQRVAFIQFALRDAHCQGVVFGNSGGKDSALVGVLCKLACPDTIGVAMPCQSTRNFGEDMEDALALARQFDIETLTVDLSQVKEALCAQIAPLQQLTQPALANVAPRLRMTTLYAVAQSRNALVAGTGNKCERYMGYFTKWGDGACDFNPIADLTVSEIYEFLAYLKAPENIRTKAPSAGLFEGQTDEAEMGVTYRDIEMYMAEGSCGGAQDSIIRRAHQITEHKRRMPLVYTGSDESSRQL